jgi:SlyX protein
VTDAERLNELEIRLTHQTLQLEELSSELLGCYRRIEALEREALRLRDMLGTLGPELIESPDE